ncbi:MAG: site-specific DNA-methyltransferase, partial [Beggiatoa sp.]|nr:site-specific DNA-methyltransferase [Beggiatoa sp.]
MVSYYAGFSEDFVSDLLSALNAQPLQSVLDPWNGSGTTTLVAARLGLEAHGYDLNPALVVVAKGRHLSTSVINSLSPLLHDIIALAQDGRSHAMFSPNDPLGIWFDAASALE